MSARKQMISINIRTMTARTFSVDIAASSTVADLKDHIAEKEGIEKGFQRLIYAGSELDDASSLTQNQIEGGSALFLVLRNVKSVAVMVKTLKDKCFHINVDPLTSVLELKHKVFEQDSTWEVARQRIIFKGKELGDDEILLNCGLCDSIPTVHVVMRPPVAGMARRKKDTDSEKCSTSSKGRTVRCGTRSAVKVKSEPVEVANSSDCYSDFGDVPSGSVMPMDFETEWAHYSMTSQSELISPLAWDADPLSPKTSTPGSASALPNEVSASLSEETSSFADMMSTSSRTAAHRLDKYVKETDTAPSTQGRAYDLSKVDDKLRKRLVKNRLSAERSRQRKQAHVETLEFELSCCRSENEHLRQRVASLEAQLAAFTLANAPKASFCQQQIALTVHA